jgi:hypothetical protein
VCDGLDNGLGALGWVARLEDTGADEDTVAAHLHHERGVGGSSDTAGGEVDDGQAALASGLLEQGVVALELAGHLAEVVVRGGRGACDLGVDGLHVADGLDDIAGAGLALGADHGGTLADAAEGLAKVTAAADEGSVEVVLFDVVDGVGGGEDLALVDVVDANGLQDLALDNVTDAGLGHDWDGDGVHDLLDHGRVGHASNTALGANVGGHTLEGHDGAGTGLFCDLCLLSVDNVHDHATLQHLGETGLDGEGGLRGGGGSAIGAVGGGHCGGGECVGGMRCRERVRSSLCKYRLICKRYCEEGRDIGNKGCESEEEGESRVVNEQDMYTAHALAALALKRFTFVVS